MPVLTRSIQNHHRMPIKRISQIAQTLLNVLDYPDFELSILIVDDLEISKLNAKYLKKKGPTNVIAFPMLGDKIFTSLHPRVIGDVVISIDTAEYEASYANTGTFCRVVELLIHGILHLVGYDHTVSKVEAIRMREISEKLFSIVEKKFNIV